MKTNPFIYLSAYLYLLMEQAPAVVLSGAAVVQIPLTLYHMGILKP